VTDTIKNVGAIAGIIGALVSAYVGYSTSQDKKELDNRQLQLQQEQQQQQTLVQQQQIDIARLSTQSDVKKKNDDLDFRVYEAVQESLKTKDLKQQQVASVLVNVMLSEPMRTQLLTAFGQSPTTDPQVRQAVDKVLTEERKFVQDDQLAKNAPSQSGSPVTSTSTGGPAGSATPTAAVSPVWGNWDFDVFWCEHSGPDAKRNAEAIVAALKSDEATGRLRARMLPDSVNARPGYGVVGFVIRKDAGEEKQATALQGLAQKAVPGSQFVIATSGSATRWYLSAFVCPSGAT
jgi:outer membrane lipoprotein SlyB